MQELIINEEINIENLIYEIRGKQVMLDSDLAKLYQCTNGTKDINKAVNRNINRFPKDFYFKITKEEYHEILRFQNGTLELKQGKYSKYLSYVFTEEGVAMLVIVLHTSNDEKIVTERIISEREYNDLVSERNDILTKDRYCFEKDNVLYRVDVFNDDLVLLEVEGYIEVDKLPEEIEIIKEVTIDENYTNKNIARMINSKNYILK